MNRAWLPKTSCGTMLRPNEQAQLLLIPRKKRGNAGKVRAQRSPGRIIGLAKTDDRQLLAG